MRGTGSVLRPIRRGISRQQGPITGSLPDLCLPLFMPLPIRPHLRERGIFTIAFAPTKETLP